MFRNSFSVFTLALLAAAVQQAQAQKVGKSGNMPYSSMGIGVLEGEGFTRHAGFGDNGVSTSYANYVNGINPAYLGINKYTTFEFGANSRYANLAAGETSQRTLGVNFAYINIAFPVHKTGGIAMTLKPYSSVRYRFEKAQAIEGDSSTMFYNYSGIGGLNAASLSYGRRVGENLFLGFTGSYVFGNISDQTQNLLNVKRNNVSSLYGPSNLKQETVQRYLELKLGAGWRKKITEDHFLNVGAVYTMSRQLQHETTTVLERQNTNGLPFLTDTIASGVTRSGTSLPSKTVIGASYGRSSRWLAGLDLRYTRWAGTYDRSGQDALADNTFGTGVYGEYNPSYLAKYSYFTRIIYRAALSYNVLPYSPNGEQIGDLKLTFGTALPLGKQFTNLNLAFDFGQMGNAEKNIRERYFNVHIGANINDVWFVRRKVD